MQQIQQTNSLKSSTSDALNYWHLPVCKRRFKTSPQFYIGQKVLHKLPVANGSIWHPVTVVGIQQLEDGYWTYTIIFPPDHPLYEAGESEYDDMINDWLLESLG